MSPESEQEPPYLPHTYCLSLANPVPLPLLIVSTSAMKDIWRQLVLHYLIALTLIMVDHERFVLN